MNNEGVLTDLFCFSDETIVKAVTMQNTQLHGFICVFNRLNVFDVLKLTLKLSKSHYRGYRLPF